MGRFLELSSTRWEHSARGASGPVTLPPAGPMITETVAKSTTSRGHPIEALLLDRLQSRDASTPDGGQTDDMRDRMVVAESSSQSNDLDPRTRRAITEEMAISLLEKGGRYEVRSGSGNRYEVDVIGESCSCPDWQQRAPDGGCKHLRRVNLEIKRGSVPRPNSQSIDLRTVSTRGRFSEYIVYIGTSSTPVAAIPSSGSFSRTSPNVEGHVRHWLSYEVLHGGRRSQPQYGCDTK